MGIDFLRGTVPFTRLLALAARNVVRHTGRSLLSLAAVATGVAALMVSGGFVNDLIFQLGESIIHSQSGHLQIAHGGYFSSGSRSPGRYLIAAADVAALQLDGRAHVEASTRRVSFSGLLSNGRSSYPIVGEGIEPEAEARLGTALVLSQGNQLAARDRYGALVGAGVARAMGLTPGTPFSVVAPTAQEAMNTLEFEVVGVFQSFSKDYDDRVIKVPLQAAQELLDTKGANVVVLLLDDTRHTWRVANELSARARSLKLEVRTWDSLNDFYWKAVALYDRQFGVLRLIVLLMVVLAVVGAINMAVFERAGEFGTMRALGNRSGDVLRLIVLEGAVLGVVGALVGLAFGWLSAWGLSEIGIPMPPPPNANLEYIARIRLSPSVVAGAGIVGVLATLLASVVPALRVSRLPVVEALRRIA